MIEKRSWKVFFLSFCICLTLGVMAYSQGTTGTFTGTVTDQSGAVVPGAAITITNQATGVKYNLSSNNQGVYFVTSVPPGQYSFDVKKQGFQTYSTRDVGMSVDYVQRLDIKLTVGSETTTITVESAAPLVSTEAGRLSSEVSGAQIINMPLNGRNIYNLMQLVPGAVNSGQADTELGQGTNINGTRMNFNGFLLDGLTNKGLSGGTYADPPPDFVAEFRIQTNNFDAQYSNSAGSVTDVSTRSGTNDWHGDAFEFVRNDKFDARNFFDPSTKGELRMNEFGGTLGGPIKKDKLFIFGGVEFERFRKGVASQFYTESPDFIQAIQSAIPNGTGSLLYKNFPGPAPNVGVQNVNQIACGNAQGEYAIWDPADTNCQTPQVDAYATGTTLLDPTMVYTDPCFLNQWNGVGLTATGSVPWGNPQIFANNMAKVFGMSNAQNAQITANIAAACPGQFTAPPVGGGSLALTAPMEGFVNATNVAESAYPFYTGSKWVTRGDYQGDTNRVSARFFLSRNSDPNPTPTTGIRGFLNPATGYNVSSAVSFVHTFTPTFLNEFEVGHARNQTGDIPIASQFGVPNINFDTGEPSFGSYNGYPQNFIEEQFNFKDMVTWVKGKHSMKMGAEFKKNYENSEFNVGRPSYYFFDPFYLAGDLPYYQAAGVNPELPGVGGTGSSHIDTNIRGWRNYELGFFVQDDFKVTPKFTLNLGLRWDYFSPHTEKYGHATEFKIPSGGIGTINCAAFTGTTCIAPFGDNQTPNGGFTTTHGIFPARYNNWGPRFGFAYDPWGNGKTSIRGGFAIQYEASFYNALSNSRWNLPFYSFNEACPIACGVPGYPTFGPTDANGNPTGGAWVPNGVAPTWTGDPATSGTVGNGPAGLGFAGNISGWLPSNPNLASLTGIPSPTYRLPYVMNYFLSLQHQITRSTVLTVSGVSTMSRHLFWAEDPNRVVGGKLRAGVTNPCDGTVHTNTGLLNPCFGHLRTWDTSVNSSYFALQSELERRMGKGLMFTASYTWSHSLDYRSTWHALSSGGSADEANATGASGYSADPNRLFLEKGNSIFDVRHRFVTSIIYDLPWMKDMTGVEGKVLGGWTLNSSIELQSGFPFTVGASKDYNLDSRRGDRPNVRISDQQSFSSSDVKLGANGAASAMATALAAGNFPAPVCTVVGSISCDGNEGRNTFRGPGIATTDFSVFKKIPLGSNESRYLQFRAEAFNLFNRPNFNPPVANLSSGEFGTSTGTLDPRQIQFALKLIF